GELALGHARLHVSGGRRPSVGSGQDPRRLEATERSARRRRAAIADFPLAARPANATIITASGPAGCPRTSRSIRFRIDSDSRRRGCDTWMRVADSAALSSAQEPSAELPRPTERDSEGSAARAWLPRGV